MAKYEDLFNLHNDSDLLNRVTVAVIIAANTVAVEDVATTNHTERKAWALDALGSPGAQAKKALLIVLAENNGATITQIQNATDATLQTAVDGIVDLLAGV